MVNRVLQNDVPQPIGDAPSFLEALERVSKVAPLDRPVLVVGERGTGKELIAARLHYLSQRWERPFVKTNCAAIADTLVESELFGHEAGAFTGANKRRMGRFETADTGTLFLDEIAGASLAVQEKILRAVEYGEFERVGGNETLSVDVRVIGATNLDLPDRATRGLFRADLLDRLAFDVITLPPLRARQGDITLLAEIFGQDMAADLGWQSFEGFAPVALEELETHNWPGNIRELKNVVERAVYSAPPGAPIDRIIVDPFDSPYRPARDPGDLDKGGSARAPGSGQGDQFTSSRDLKKAVGDLERSMVERALAETRYNRRAAASHLGLTYSQMRHLLNRHSI